VVKILDQLNIAEAAIIQDLSKQTETVDGKQVPIERKRKFTIAPLLDKDLEDIKKAGGI
jgi:hypothetical protein